MSKKLFTQEDLDKAYYDGRAEGRRKSENDYKFDRTIFILELISALNLTGGTTITREALEKMVIQDD